MAAEITRRIQNEMIDVMENEVLGPAIRQGLEQGRQEGRVEGRSEGMALLLETQLEKRFGSLPPMLKERLFAAPPAALATWSLRILDASSLEEVFA